MYVCMTYGFGISDWMFGYLLRLVIVDDDNTTNIHVLTNNMQIH